MEAAGWILHVVVLFSVDSNQMLKGMVLHRRSLAEGRAPWGGQPVMASAELGEHEAGVWAAACDALGRLLVTGTEDGSVVAQDARCLQTLWQVRCGFISLAWGVCRSPCGILMQSCT